MKKTKQLFWLASLLVIISAAHFSCRKTGITSDSDLSNPTTTAEQNSLPNTEVRIQMKVVW